MTAQLQPARVRARHCFLMLVMAALCAACVTPASAQTSSAPSVGNGRIVYQVSTGSSAELYSAKSDGSDPQRLTNNTVADQDPAVSRDGTKIAWVQGVTGSREIWVMNADGSGTPTMLTGSTPADDSDPAWSSDGSKLAWLHHGLGTNNGIWRMNADGTAVSQLTRGAGLDSQPAWSPDGSQVAFATSRFGAVRIAKVNANVVNGTPQFITGGPGATLDPAAIPQGENSAPVWSPDGTRIALSNRRTTAGFVGQIWTVNAADGSDPREISTGGTAPSAQPNARSAAWAPEGNAIVFERDFNLFRVDLAATPATQTQITHDSSAEVNPSWGGTFVDTTAPTINVTTPVEGATYPVGALVASSFTCAEAGTPQSGVATCVGPATLDTSALGPKTFTVTTSDAAGNTASRTVNYLVTDQTDPTITFDVPANGSPYGVGETVVSAFDCNDAHSDIASCDGPGEVDTSTLGTHSFTVTATDTAGNTFTDSIEYDVTDQTDPTITFDVPANGSPYAIGEDVRAAYSCSDEHGVAVSCEGTVPVGDPIATGSKGTYTFEVTATDDSGNTDTQSIDYEVTDQEAPAVAFLEPASGSPYAIGENVSADYTCSDAHGTVTQCEGSVAVGDPLDTSRGSHTFEVTTTDDSGNTDTQSITYEVTDQEPPDVVFDKPANGSPYGVDEVVNAAYSCSDEHGTVTDCSGDVPNGEPIATSTLGTHTFSVETTDDSGNTTTESIDYEVVDRTKPTIEITAPVDGSSVDHNAEVLADYACADAHSDVVRCEGTVADGSAVDTAQVGTETFEVTAEDAAGNVATKSVSYEVEDVTDPTVTLTTPEDGDSYARGSSVAADFSCADETGGSGLASCVGTVPDGSDIDTDTLGTEEFSVTATDNSGRTRTKTVEYTVVDGTDPTATIDSPVDGSVFTLGQTVNADFSCSDDAGGSGIDTCVGDVADGSPIDTNDVGTHTFSVTATDKAGNTDMAANDYAVHYAFTGFYKPVVNLAAGVNVMKAGRAVPIKFSLNGYQGMGVLDSPDSVKIDCASHADTNEVAETLTAGSSDLSYDASSDQYTYVWKTSSAWAGTCRDLRVKLDDGTARRLRFEFR